MLTRRAFAKRVAVGAAASALVPASRAEASPLRSEAADFEVEVGKTVEITSSFRYCWYPTVHRFPAGEIMVTMRMSPDEANPEGDFSAYCLSSDGGLTWSKEAETAPKDQGVGGLGGGGGMGGGNGTMEVGAGAAMFFARMATRYMYRYGYTYDEFKHILAKISVKNHHNGSLNPKAHFQRDITEEQAVNAPLVAWPLGLYDACGVSDGCACAIVTRADMAKSFRDDYILVKGLGLAVGARQGYLQPGYDMTHMEETVRAAKQAYEQAGIKDPFNEIDLCEVHDCFSITELVIMEDLGFAPRGKAPELVKAGTFELNGKLAVNPDGGLKSFGHPIGASGLRMAYEVYKQMQGKAGPRQRKNPKLGLTHNFGMNPGSGMGTVTIFGQRD